MVDFMCTSSWFAQASWLRHSTSVLCSGSLLAHLHVVGVLRFIFSDINQPSLPTLFIIFFVSASVSMAVSTIFRSIHSPNKSKKNCD